MFVLIYIKKYIKYVFVDNYFNFVHFTLCQPPQIWLEKPGPRKAFSERQTAARFPVTQLSKSRP